MTARLLPCCYPSIACLFVARRLSVYYPSIALLLPECYLPVAFCVVFVEIFNKILGKQEKFVSL